MGSFYETCSTKLPAGVLTLRAKGFVKLFLVENSWTMKANLSAPGDGKRIKPDRKSGNERIIGLREETC
jgi:hypothetical protein